MEISSPLCITSRLLPGCRIGGACISIEYCSQPDRYPEDGRTRYHWRIDLPNGGEEFQEDELYSRVGGGTLQEGLESLLGYLGAFAEAQAFEQRKPDGTETENGHLFPAGLADWAVENADAIAAMELELQEHPNKLIVE